MIQSVEYSLLIPPSQLHGILYLSEIEYGIIEIIMTVPRIDDWLYLLADESVLILD